jgi:exopolysaccharide production protein ExoZ
MEPAGLNRWASLDYFRGLMALAVLTFHFDKWQTGVWDASTLQGKFGVYGVSAFFVLSGMALQHTYHDALHQPGKLGVFALKRIFRIYPLLWVATGATLLLDDEARSWADIALNFSGLFGFVDPARDIATGAWSIGCELVFYALFPLLCAAFRFWAAMGWLMVAGLAGFGWLEAFQWPFYPADTDQKTWWPAYVQVAQHLFFFAAGVAIAASRNQLQRLHPAFWQCTFVLCFVVFWGIPVGAQAIVLISGFWRITFSCLAILLVASWSFGFHTLPSPLHRVFAWLGSISYGVYLLHPLVYRVVKAMLVPVGLDTSGWLIPLAVVLSLLAGHLSFHWLERPCMRLGARLTMSRTAD